MISGHAIHGPLEQLPLARRTGVLDQGLARKQAACGSVALLWLGDPLHESTCEPVDCLGVTGSGGGEVDRAKHARPGQKLLVGGEPGHFAIQQLDRPGRPYRQSLVCAPAVRLGEHRMRCRQTESTRVVIFREARPRAREPRFRRRIV